MQTFIDTKTQQVWQFDDDVIVTDTAGVYSFTAAHGVVLNVPVTLQPYVIPAPTAAQLLATAQSAQIATLQAAYTAAMVAPVTVTLASGTVATFATDAQAVSNLSNVLVTNAKLGTWKPNYWLDVNGAVVTPVTYADLQNIASAIQNVVVLDNQSLHTKIGQVIAATTVAAVQKITF